jgi:hypothetical protein
LQIKNCWHQQLENNMFKHEKGLFYLKKAFLWYLFIKVLRSNDNIINSALLFYMAC